MTFLSTVYALQAVAARWTARAWFSGLICMWQLHAAWQTCPLGAPLVTPYYCRLGDLLCFVFMSAYCTFDFFCVLYLFLQYFDTVGWVFLTCKTRLRYNLYCVGGDVKHYSIQSKHAASPLTSATYVGGTAAAAHRRSGLATLPSVGAIP